MTVELALFAVVVGNVLEAVPLDSDVVAMRTSDSVEVAVGTIDDASLDAIALPVAEDMDVSRAACVLLWAALDSSVELRSCDDTSLVLVDSVATELAVVVASAKLVAVTSMVVQAVTVSVAKLLSSSREAPVAEALMGSDEEVAVGSA